MSTAAHSVKSHLGDQLVANISKIESFLNSDTFKILLAIFQAIILPLLYVAFQYFFRNPSGASFVDCIPCSLFVAPLFLAKSLLPTDLTSEKGWKTGSRVGTINKTALTALFVGVGLMTTSMLASQYLTGGFGMAPVFMSVFSIVACVIGAFSSKSLVSPPQKIVDEAAKADTAETITEEQTNIKEVTVWEKRRNDFLTMLLATLFLVSVAALLGGLVAAAVFMVIGIAMSMAFAFMKKDDEDVEEAESKMDKIVDDGNADS